MVVAHVVDLLRYHGVLLVSENCVLLHGAVEEEADPTALASFRRNEAKAMVVAHVVDLLRYHGVLLVSENCVLLHGAVEEKADPTPMAAAAAPKKGPAQREKGQAAGSGSLSGGEAAGNSSTPEPVGDDESQDDRDLVHLVTVQSHGYEVCAIFPSYSYSSRGEAGLPDTILSSWFTENEGEMHGSNPYLSGSMEWTNFVCFVLIYTFIYISLYL